jgi:hypothetical protein
MDLGTVSGVGLTSANFNTTIAAAPTFEFWTATGARQTVAGDTDLSVGNVKSGIAIYGVTGDYPSATYRLANNTGTDDLTTFITQLTTDGAFEYFDSTGARYTGSGDSDLVAAKIKSGEALENLSITGTWGPAPTNWDVRVGVVVNGVTGALKTNCRNTVNSGNYNWDGLVTNLPTTASTTGTTLDYWDTIDDGISFPSGNVWSADTLCDSSVWSDVTTINGGTSYTSCGTSSTCIYKDQLSGLKVTGVLGITGNVTDTVTPDNPTWNAAVKKCAASTYGGYAAGSWRLPTQKELMALYEHGIASLVGANFIVGARYWSASSLSGGTNAWDIYLTNGTTYYDGAKIHTRKVVCVR